MKKKVHELAKEMGVRSKDLIVRAGALGIEVKSHMSSLTEEEIGKIRDGGTPETGKAKTGKGGSSQTNSGVGTGGTITGIGEYLKSINPDIKVVAVEPLTSAVLSGKTPKGHGIEGIGAGFVPDILNTEIYDEVIKISDEEAFSEGRNFARTEGVMVGISSGAALKAGVILARRKENKHKNIVVLLPDSGDRYLSTKLFKEE